MRVVGIVFFALVACLGCHDPAKPPPPERPHGPLGLPQAAWNVTVSVVGGGMVRLTDKSGDSLTVADRRTILFTSGTVLHLKAIPQPTRFLSWGGDCSGESDECSVIVNQDRSVVVNFESATHRLTVQITGSGSVTAGGLDCSITPDQTPQHRTCVADFFVGEAVRLSTSSPPGFYARSLTGGCAEWCDLTMDADKIVAWEFTPIVERRLNVSIVGDGSVLGYRGVTIDCPGQCSGSYTDLPYLYAVPAFGWRLAEWRGGGCSGNAICSPSRDADAEVVAVFEQLPPLPPPPPECAELLPRGGSDHVAVTLGYCSDELEYATSDGSGTFAIDKDGGAGGLGGRFVRIENGVAVESGWYGGGSFRLYPQPSGFLETFQGESGADSLHAYDTTGVETLQEIVTPGDSARFPITALFAPDPAGGIAILRTHRDVDGAILRQEFRRSASNGVPETDFRFVDWGRDPKAIASSSSGRLLALSVTGRPGSWHGEARWFDRDGNAEGDWFSLPSAGCCLYPLPSGGIVVASLHGQQLQQVQLVPDGEQRVTQAPAWWVDRWPAPFVPVRQGRAVAVPGSLRCVGSVELLTNDGASCGCLSEYGLPIRLSRPSVGRDGSLIVPATAHGDECTYELYPQLFQ